MKTLIHKINVFCVFMAVMFMPLAWAIDPSESLPDPEQQMLYEEITKEVRCLVCQNQTIADSTAPLAADLRREIRRKIVAGESETQIKDFLVDRYGGYILYKPRFEAWNWLIWLAPLVLLLAGLAGIARFARNRANMPIDRDAD